MNIFSIYGFDAAWLRWTAAAGNGTHFSFLDRTVNEVNAFQDKALEMGGVRTAPSSLRPLYAPQYFGAFVRDLDGHKIKAMC